MGEIRLFVCCHKPSPVPKHPLLVPVQVGTALAGERFEGFAHDDEGENISRLNRSYCELTAHYWAWKNVYAGYYGFFHYRRYLYPRPEVKKPYRLERQATLPLLTRMGYDRFADLIAHYDLIAPKGENMYIPVRKHYADAPHQHDRDLALLERLVRAKHPEMAQAMERYLSDTVCYFGNIYIMRREVFSDYCAWLFPLLAEFDACTDVRGYDEQERRVDGYLGERLFGVYLTYHRARLKTLELPRVHFYSDTEYVRQRLLDAVLPPGGKRRSAVKQILHRRGAE